MTPAATAPAPLQAWAFAARPRTLVAGVVPVAVGSALAWRDHGFSAPVALAALAGALLIQIGTNLANDYFDFKRGADTAERVGPPRASQRGWLRPEAVFRGALGCFAAAMAIGLYLVAVGGWPLLVIGLASVAAGYAYTGGPWPLGYLGLGEVFVLAFFGFVAVGGTYLVQTGHLTADVAFGAIAVGAPAVALLAVNNLRDAATDAKVGKRTLVVRFGSAFGKTEWLTALSATALTPVLGFALGRLSPWALASLLALPLAVPTARRVLTAKGAELNLALAGTARFQLVFGLLFAWGVSR